MTVMTEPVLPGRLPSAAQFDMISKGTMPPPSHAPSLDAPRVDPGPDATGAASARATGSRPGPNTKASLDEEALAKRAIAGDRAAQEAVYRLHGPFLFALATRLLGSREQASDVFQDSFVRAIEKIHTLRDPKALRSWLAQILVNRARNVIRRERFRRRLGLTTTIPESEYIPPGDFVLEGRLAWHDVTRLLHKLPPDARVAWWLQRVERYTVREVAELTGSTVDKVKKRLVAAEKKIAAYREEHLAP